MSQLSVNAITNAAGGNTATINGMTPTADSLQGFRNRIINGDMRIAQRGTAAVNNNGAVVLFPVDRFPVYGSVSDKFSAQQNAGSVAPPAGFTNYLGCTSLSAYTVGASEFNSVQHRFEGFNIADLGWGTANAQPVTLSFWVRSSLTGTFGGSIRNSALNRSYPFAYTISSANTWEYKTITIPGDTAGTWLSDNGLGLRLDMGLGVGSTLSGTAGAWASSNFISATGAVSVVGTSGATFYITGVQLEAGAVATPFERRPYGAELQLCQRYYQLINGFQGLAINSNSAIAGVICPVQMRATPSSAATSALTITDTSNSYTQSSPAASGITGNGFGGRITLSNFAGLTNIRPFVDNGNGGSIALSSEL